MLYGVHRSRAHRWTQDLLPVLEQTLGYQMILPERQIHEVEGFFQRFPTAQTLFVDGSERPTYRPQERLAQKTLTGLPVLVQLGRDISVFDNAFRTWRRASKMEPKRACKMEPLQVP